MSGPPSSATRAPVAVVGLASGVVLAWVFGDIAARRLEATGTDLLATMRASTSRKRQLTGDVDWSEISATLDGADLGEGRLGIAKASPARRAIVFACFTLCWVPLIAQGLVPSVLKYTDPERDSWFVARIVPEALHWPVAGIMVLIGLGIIATGFYQLSVARAENMRAVMDEATARPSVTPEREKVDELHR